MKRAAIMSRVSSDEQAKGYSLDVQASSLTKYCERNAISIKKTIKEDHSAKSFDRPAFKDFLFFLKENKGQIDLLLFTTWDRFSRNTAEAYEMISRLRKLGVEPQATEQPLDLTIPENKAMLAFYLAIPEIENDRRSIKITGGIQGARKSGRWTHMAPYGYKNSRDENNKPIIIPTENAKNVRFAFEKVALGIPMIEVRMLLHKKGYKVSKSQFSDILRNVLYMGMIKIKAAPNQPEHLVKGIHKPIIYEDLFYTVQNILSGKMKKLNKPSLTKRRPELLLRGVLNCNKCGRHLTGSPSKSHNGTIHFYYHCNHCKKERYPAPLVNNIMEKVLDDFKFSQDIVTVYKAMLKRAFSSENKDVEKRKKEITEEILLQDNRLENLKDLLVDQKITAAEYSTMKNKYEEIKSNLLIEIGEKKIMANNFEKNLEYASMQISNLGGMYRSFELDRKVQLVSSIFPQKISFDGNKCRTEKINEVIRLAYLSDKGSKENKTEQLYKYLELFGVVENIGVEPTTSCMPCKRSSQLS